MDCCNYVPYRHHQGYYGYYNEPLPPYHGDFYGHHNMYHDYYGNINPYYSPHQHWQGGGVFAPQDYVYNPKEARLRKAMREAASRDRSIGASPMLPRPSARRVSSAEWATSAAGPPGTPTLHVSHEEPLMMSPLGQGMRGPGLDAPCFPSAMSSTSGRISRSGNEQFMPPSMEAAAPSSGYSGAKMHQDSPIPPPPAPTPTVHAAYMQPNPLTQLQQQTEMWHNYQDDLRPRSSGNPFMMQDIQSPYHHHQPSPPLSIPSPMMMDKHRQTPVHHIHNVNSISMPMTPPHSNSIMAMTPPHSNENVPPDEPLHLKEKMMPQDFQHLAPKQTVEAPQPLMENNVQHQNEYGNSIFGGSVGVSQQQSHHQQFEKMEDTKIKRSNPPSSISIARPSYSVAPKKPSSKPLPDFNEAFGSTERGRFQSPPDPRLGPNKGYLDFFCEDGPQLKFEDFQM
ncbi:uncharacterized protein LOC126883174 [Diabrotica virgifera virgifera]|uniref:Uncharacterized protein n=1 Tax=Diabrotica virgifera virgifera TaxID=50390 RepID=A0ABM5K2G0_DIAVI|nr:uncharacterized protein LOC126883174 [Diabrotica virgifera virgifera]